MSYRCSRIPRARQARQPQSTASPGLGAADGRAPGPRLRPGQATGGFSYGQVRNAYGIGRLGSGAGASVAILNFGEGARAGDIAANAPLLCLSAAALADPAHRRSDGPFGRGTFEPEEDLALVRGMAPGCAR